MLQLIKHVTKIMVKRYTESRDSLILDMIKNLTQIQDQVSNFDFNLLIPKENKRKRKRKWTSDGKLRLYTYGF